MNHKGREFMFFEVVADSLHQAVDDQMPVATQDRQFFVRDIWYRERRERHLVFSRVMFNQVCTLPECPSAEAG